MSLSGYRRAEKNVSHRVEDSLKNMKSCSDFLKYLTCSFKSSNIETMKKLRIPCINIIGDTMTVSLCYIGSRQKWAFVEARSTIIPTRLTDKNNFIKAFELLAFLEDIINRNHEAINELELESLGLVGCDYTSVSSYFQV